MTSKEFAETHAGCMVMINYGIYKGEVGRVIGYSGSVSICIELNKTYGSYYQPIFVVDYNTIRGMKWYFCFTDLILMPKISNTPDSCDDCGAVGEEECKNNCPNKM